MYDASDPSLGASEDEGEDGWEMIAVEELRVGVEADAATLTVEAREEAIGSDSRVVSMYSRALDVAATAVGAVSRERRPSSSSASATSSASTSSAGSSASASASAVPPLPGEIQAWQEVEALCKTLKAEMAADAEKWRRQSAAENKVEERERETTKDETESTGGSWDAEQTPSVGSFAVQADPEPPTSAALASSSGTFLDDDELCENFQSIWDSYHAKIQFLKARAVERAEDHVDESTVFDHALIRFTRVAAAACREFRSLAASGADASRARWERFVRWVARMSRRRQDLMKRPYANMIFVVTVGGVCFIIHRRWLAAALQIEENAMRIVHADLSSIEERFDRCFRDVGFSSSL